MPHACRHGRAGRAQERSKESCFAGRAGSAGSAGSRTVPCYRLRRETEKVRRRELQAPIPNDRSRASLSVAQRGTQPSDTLQGRACHLD